MRDWINNDTSYLQLALTILAIATAVAGFGLFQASVQDGEALFALGQQVKTGSVKLGLGLGALIAYLGLMFYTSSLLRQEEKVTGQQLAEGSLTMLLLETLMVALIYVIGLFDRPLTSAV